MMRTRCIFKDSDLSCVLLPLLEGRVFHVSRLSNVSAILRAGAIMPNVAGRLRSTFGHATHAFFAHCGCVSMFDLRSSRPGQGGDDDPLWRCSPWRAAADDSGVAIFVLAPEDCIDLVPWTAWQPSPELIIPYVEAGHLGPISLASVEELFEIQVEASPDPFLATLQKMGRRQRVSRSLKK